MLTELEIFMNNKVTGFILFSKDFTHIVYMGDDLSMGTFLKGLAIYFQYLVSDLQIRLVCRRSWGVTKCNQILN